MLDPTIATPAFRECEHIPDTILILYDTQPCRDKLIEEMGKLLSWQPVEEPTEYTTPGGGTGEEQVDEGDFGSLCLKTQHVLGITNKLDLDSNNNRVAAINERVNEIRQFVPEVPQDKLWGALVALSSLCKDQITWLSYPKALQNLLNERWDPDSVADEIAPEGDEETNSTETQRDQNACNQFVTKCLRDCLYTPIDKENKPGVLFMVAAQNARKLLPWLKNPQLPNDFPNSLQNMIESERKRLWLVRVRDKTNGEVPVNIVETEKVKDFGGRATGVFRWENICDNEEQEIFLSLREGLDTEQNLLRTSESRLENGKKGAGSKPLLEIAILHNPGIEAEKLACFVHSLRKRWPYFSSSVSLPFPFPFAKKAKEYAVSAQDEPEEEPEDEPEDEPVQLTLFDL